MSKLTDVKMFDAHGKETFNLLHARSKVEFRNHDFRFFEKTITKRFIFFGSPVIKWKFHHQSSTFGSWMWPDGLPLRFDGVDNAVMAAEHAAKIGSDWRPGLDK